MKVVVQEPWVPISYRDALHIQENRTREGEVGWLLFTCQPTITLGKRTDEGEVLISHDQLKKRGIEILEVDRGGKATYHGPEQILGFPLGTLEQHTGHSKGVKKFVDKLISSLEKYASGFAKVDYEKSKTCPGIWVWDKKNNQKKVASLGLGFSRSGIRHGFALNVFPAPDAFSLINPCGLPSESLGALFGAEHVEFMEKSSSSLLSHARKLGALLSS